MKIHHVNITIPLGAEDKARAFYCDLLGLPEVEKPDSLKPNGGLWVRVGDRDLHIGVEDGIDRNATQAHIAYQVEDLAAIRAKIAAADLPIKESTPIPGYDRFECRDPFGNRVEFITPQQRTTRQLISSGAPWEAMGGYSRGVRVGNRVLIAGTVAVDGEGNVIAPNEAYIQARHIFTEIIGPALQEAGASLTDVVRTRMFATHIADFEELARAHGEIFGEVRPASTLLEVSALVDPTMRVEIEAEAVIQ